MYIQWLTMAILKKHHILYVCILTHIFYVFQPLNCSINLTLKKAIWKGKRTVMGYEMALG
jgi:hypothetical protein